MNLNFKRVYKNDKNNQTNRGFVISNSMQVQESDKNVSGNVANLR